MNETIIVYELGTSNEFHFSGISKESALLSAYATAKGYMSNFIKNNYKSIDGIRILESSHYLNIGDFTVKK